jgi:hypothetical protein
MSSQLLANNAQVLEALDVSWVRSKLFIERLKRSCSPSGSVWSSAASPVPFPCGGPRGSFSLSTTQAVELAIPLRNPHRSQGRGPKNQKQILRGGIPCHDSIS